MTSISRQATHAGSWYSDDKQQLTRQIEGWMKKTSREEQALPGCRLIISPHAGYSYSGPTAAYGFSALNLTGVRRIFVLGPSHHFFTNRCLVSKFERYATPLGYLTVDDTITKELLKTGEFDCMSESVDEDEHSIEMQMPYLAHLTRDDADVTIIPILVGNLDLDGEKHYGHLLRPYLQDPSNAFVISSDFCHWGSRFSYMYYKANDGAAVKRVSSKDIGANTPIWSSIEDLDHEGMSAIETGSTDDFSSYLKRTKNTICGRHPIAVILAAMDSALLRDKHFRFIHYEQSSQVVRPTDSSVSYASGICCL